MRRFITILTVCFVLFAATAMDAPAQRRTRRTPRAPATPRVDQAKVNAARLQLAEQVKDMTRFLYVYGRLSKDLELTAAQARSADVASQAKAGLLDSVRVMRDRLDKLEVQFRFTPGLEREYKMIEGVSIRADDAARMAAANRYDQAGRTLLEISTILTDALSQM